MERNKELVRENQMLSKEVFHLTKEVSDAIMEKTNQKGAIEKIIREGKEKEKQQEVMISSLKAENTRLVNETNMYLKNSDMVRNIKLLNDAYAAKKITEGTHAVRNIILDKIFLCAQAQPCLDHTEFTQSHNFSTSTNGICSRSSSISV